MIPHPKKEEDFIQKGRQPCQKKKDDLAKKRKTTLPNMEENFVKNGARPCQLLVGQEKFKLKAANW